ncbi:MAG: hypothetical protein N4A49_13530 [Marinifilaceae bacterium]|jgi:hypothetical protein|nr:hypothetical protein [Marinifilaceae bacterium]
MKIKNLLFVLFAVIAMACSTQSKEDSEITQLEKKKVFTYNEYSKTIELNGVINSRAFNDFKLVSNNHPQVKWINIVNCEGSINDDVNLSLSNYVYENGFSIKLLENGIIASGGTDFFLAGKKRVLEKNSKVGVHSWTGDGKVATDFPKGHKYHLPYIRYYKNIGMTDEEAEDFYYFTINSASANDIHWMTDEELKKYKFEN